MDGTELGREVAPLRVEGRAHAKLGALRRGQPEAAAATAADCAATTRNRLGRCVALRRRPGPDPLPAWWAACQTSGGGPFAGAP